MFAGCPAPPAVWSSNTRSSINILRLVLSPLRRRELAPLAARLILPSQWGVGCSALLLGFSVAPKTLLPPVGQRPGFGAVFTSNYWRGGGGDSQWIVCASSLPLLIFFVFCKHTPAHTHSLDPAACVLSHSRLDDGRSVASNVRWLCVSEWNKTDNLCAPNV